MHILSKVEDILSCGEMFVSDNSRAIIFLRSPGQIVQFKESH